jgi:hypothetical protein
MGTSALNSQSQPAVTREKTPLSRLRTLLVSAILLILTGVVIWNMPHGYNVDLSRIGKGQSVIVLVYDRGKADSVELKHRLDKIRPEYQNRIDFLITDFRTPEGRAFAAEHGVGPATLVLFGHDGGRLATIYGTKATEELHSAFVSTFFKKDAEKR